MMVALNFFVFCWLFFTQTISMSNEAAFGAGLGMFMGALLGFIGLAWLGTEKIRLAQIFFTIGMVITILNFLAFIWLRVTSVINYPPSDAATGVGILFGVMAIIAGIFSIGIASSGLDDFFKDLN